MKDFFGKNMTAQDFVKDALRSKQKELGLNGLSKETGFCENTIRGILNDTKKARKATLSLIVERLLGIRAKNVFLAEYFSNSSESHAIALPLATVDQETLPIPKSFFEPNYQHILMYATDTFSYDIYLEKFPFQTHYLKELEYEGTLISNESSSYCHFFDTNSTLSALKTITARGESLALFETELLFGSAFEICSYIHESSFNEMEQIVIEAYEKMAKIAIRDGKKFSIDDPGVHRFTFGVFGINFGLNDKTKEHLASLRNES